MHQQGYLCEWNIRFFTQIRSYFGYRDHDNFWRRVIFFNYLPSLVGRAGQRFSHGTPEQRRIAQERFQRILREKVPQKVLVFTSSWWAFPPMETPQSLGPEFPRFLHGRYNIGGHHIAAFFLRHPQGASGDVMRRAVKYVLDGPNPDDD